MDPFILWELFQCQTPVLSVFSDAESWSVFVWKEETNPSSEAHEFVCWLEGNVLTPLEFEPTGLMSLLSDNRALFITQRCCVTTHVNAGPSLYLCGVSGNLKCVATFSSVEVACFTSPCFISPTCLFVFKARTNPGFYKNVKINLTQKKSYWQIKDHKLSLNKIIGCICKVSICKGPRSKFNMKNVAILSQEQQM